MRKNSTTKYSLWHIFASCSFCWLQTWKWATDIYSTCTWPFSKFAIGMHFFIYKFFFFIYCYMAYMLTTNLIFWVIDELSWLGFSADIWQIFMRLARIVIGTHIRGYFYGDLINRVRILTYFNPTVSFDAYTSNIDDDVNVGKLHDIIHFRRMVALILRISFTTKK